MNDVSDELPEGWCVPTIAELCDLNPKHDSVLKSNLPVSFVPMAAVSEVEGKIITPEVKLLSEVKKGYTHFADGDVILAKITPCMENGKAASVRGMVNGLACGTTEFFVLRSRGAIDQDYLFRFIRQESFRRAARATMQSGVGQARVPKDFVLETKIPLAPLPEQRRIVAKIEALQARSRKAREALEAIPPLLEQFRQSVLAAAFRGDLTADWREQHPDVESASVLLERIRSERRRKWEDAELAKFKAKGKVPKDDSWKEKYVEPEPVDDEGLPELPKGWCWTSVGGCTWSVKDGPHVSPKYSESGIPFISGRNVRPEGVDFSTAKYISPELHVRFAERCKPELGDILYTKGGTTGIARVNTYNVEFNVWVHVAVLKLIANVLPFYIQHALNSRHCYDQAQRLTHGVGNQDLGLTRMVSITVALAPLREQRVIVDRIDAYMKAIEAIERDAIDAVAQLGSLDQSILAKAFRGELVPQDPNDEPTSVLLERIQAERADGKSSKTPRGRRKR